MENLQSTNVPAETQSTETKVTYPTAPDAEGFYFADEQDAELRIYTKVYPNGNRVKRTDLPCCGKTAIVRELLAKDTKDIARFMDKDPEKYQMAGVTVATTLDGAKVAFEVIEGLKMKDYQRLLGMYGDLNF